MSTGTTRRQYRYQYSIDPNLRKTAEQKAALLEWVEANYRTGSRPTPEELIAEATREGSRLREVNLIETDTGKIVNKFQRSEAQYCLRHIRVMRIDIRTQEKTPAVNSHVGIRTYQGRIPDNNYLDMKRAPYSPAASGSILDRAYNDLMAWVHRYSDYEEFLGSFKPLLEIIEDLENILHPEEEDEEGDGST